MLKPIRYWFSNISIARKISLLLSIIFAGSVIAGGTALAQVLQNSAQNTISGQAVQLMATMNAISSYTNNQVAPLFQETLTDTFIPEAFPAFTSREVFNTLKQENASFKTYMYKDAVLDPTNPQDKASPFEVELIEKWKAMPDEMGEITGYHTTPEGSRFYISKPIRITNPSCLECHSTPDQAPKSMVEIYGPDNGFNWPLNEVIGTQIVEVPVSKVQKATRQSFLTVMGIFVILFTTSIFAVDNWLKLNIIRPIKQISWAAEEISTGNLDVEFSKRSNDEIGLLATSFNRMKTSITLAINKLEDYQRRQSP